MRNNKNGYYFGWSVFLIMLAMGLSGCIDEYSPGNITRLNNILVVEGTITEGTTIIRLSKSVGIDKQITGRETVSTARMFIECSDGTRSEMAVITPYGYYTLRSGDLDADKQYRLCIDVEGENYVSQFLKPLPESEIVSLKWTKNGQGSSVKVLLDGRGDDENKYFKWEFTEHWEVHSQYEANCIMDEEGNIHMFDLSTEDNIYFCWGQERATGLRIKSVDKLTVNMVSDYEIVSMSPSDERLSYLYCIDITQSLLRKESYDYFNNILKNSEQSGDVFSTTPSELHGNIKCTTNSKKNVIGYVDVAKSVSQKFFVSVEEGAYEEPWSDCEKFEEWKEYTELFRIKYDEEKELTTYKYTYPYCKDCRLHRLATKNKPSFWPNEHL